MKKPIKIILWSITTAFIIAVTIICYKSNRIWNGYNESIIIARGPFHTRFPDLYPDTPDNKKAVEQWFLDTIPLGTDRKDARRMLNQSFSEDVTTGRKIVIHERGSVAGGSSTSVMIQFDNNGKVKSIQVDQYEAYL